MITRRQPPVKQNPQSFLHCRKIAKNRCKTQKSCKFNLQVGCGFYPFRHRLRRCHLPQGDANPLSHRCAMPAPPKGGAFGMVAKFLAKPQSRLPGSHPFCLAASRQSTFPKGTALALPEALSLLLMLSTKINGVRPLSQALLGLTALPRGEPRALPEAFSLHLKL